MIKTNRNVNNLHENGGENFTSTASEWVSGWERIVKLPAKSLWREPTSHPLIIKADDYVEIVKKIFQIFLRNSCLKVAPLQWFWEKIFSKMENIIF